MDGFVYHNPIKTIFIIVALFTLAFLYRSGKLRDILPEKYEGYEGEALAKILEVKPVTRVINGRFGTRILIDKYSVQYAYSVERVPYIQSDSVYNKADNLALIEAIVNDNTTGTVLIHYNPNDPSRSFIHR